MTTILERAFELAQSGKFRSIEQIRTTLHQEGFSHFELRALDGKALQKQLKAIWQAQPQQPGAQERG